MSIGSETSGPRIPIQADEDRIAAEPAEAAAEPSRWRLGTETRWAVAVFLVVVGVYGLTMGGHTYSVDGETYLAGTRALLNGTTVITPTPDIDAVVVLVEHKNGGLTTIAPIGTLLLFAPFYVLGRLVSLPFSGIGQEEVLRLVFLSANSVMTALTAALLVPLCRLLGARLRSSVFLAFAFAFGTWAWPHSSTGFSEPGTALMLTATMLAAVRWWQRPSPRAAALVGVLVGGAVLTRSSVVLFVPVLLLTGLLARRHTPRRERALELAAFLAGGLLPGLAFVTNAYLRFGGFLDNGYPPLPFGTPIYEGVFGQFLSSGKGVFWYAPITLVALFAARQAFLAQRRYVVTLGLLLMAHLAVYGRLYFWSGENAYGPRYMVPLLPLFIALLAPVIDSGLQWARAAKVAVVAGVVGPGLLGSLMYFNGVYFHTYGEISRNLQLETFESHQMYIAWNFQPRSSPLVLHVHSLDALLDNSIDRLGGGPGGITEMPPNFEDRIHWYARAIELDTWWAWWPAKDGPPAAYALVVVPIAALAAGAMLVRSLLCQVERRGRTGVT